MANPRGVKSQLRASSNLESFMGESESSQESFMDEPESSCEGI